MVHTSVIGCGNMGSALVRGLYESGNHSVIACDLDPDARAAVADYCTETTDDVARAGTADVVFVAVKPDIVEAVLDDLDLSADQTLVTIAAGVPTEFVEARTDARVVRIMPNLAAETRDMAAAATGGLTDEVRELLDDVGEFAEIEEAQMDIATAAMFSVPAPILGSVRTRLTPGPASSTCLRCTDDS
jgi:pyrroline-5-carboxylate reductase